MGCQRLGALITGLPADSAFVAALAGWSPELELAAATVEGLDRVVIALGGHKGKPLRIPRPTASNPPPAPARPHASTPDEVIAAVAAAFGPSSSRR